MTDEASASEGGAKPQPIFNMKAYRDATKAKQDGSKKGRRGRHKKVADSAEPDRRSLRATGRTRQKNFWIRPELSDVLDKHVGKGRLSLWLEQAILHRLEAEGYDLDS